MSTTTFEWPVVSSFLLFVRSVVFPGMRDFAIGGLGDDGMAMRMITSV